MFFILILWAFVLRFHLCFIFLVVLSCMFAVGTEDKTQMPQEGWSYDDVHVTSVSAARN